MIGLAQTHARGEPRHTSRRQTMSSFLSKPTLKALETPGRPFLHDVITPQPGGRGRTCFLLPFVLALSSQDWWSRTVSNRRPHACKARALPTELRPVSIGIEATLVGPGGLEPPTSRLSGVCSNQLSYRPNGDHAASFAARLTQRGAPGAAGGKEKRRRRRTGAL